MITCADMYDLGRRHGVWIPTEEVEPHVLMGWEIIEVVPRHTHVLMAPAAQEQGEAA